MTEKNNKMDKVKKVLCVGAGGNGSMFADILAHLVKNAQVPDDVTFTFIDYDVVEEKNILYQNFLESEITVNKAEALEKRYSPYIFGKNGKIENEDQLKDYDLFIIGADSNKCRKLIVEHCYKNNKQFIDGRSEGASFAVYADTDGWELADYLKTLTNMDSEGGSCQLPFMLENKQIDLGNRAVAPLMAQILLNKFRGISYPKELHLTI